MNKVSIKEKNIYLLKNYLKYMRSFFADMYYKMLWEKSDKINLINNNDRDTSIIVSLTSFPGRICIVHKTIKTILMQKNIKPDSIELWLAREQFPRKEKDLPKNLINLKKYGLKICWCNDIRSYKKLIPALKIHNDDIIVTADDDVYYKQNWLELLYSEYKKNNKNIYCHKVTKFFMENNKFFTISGGKEYYRGASFLNKLVGIGGVLYPPNSFDDTIYNEQIFMNAAPTNDDIWFWFMAVKNNIKICAIPNGNPKPIDVLESYATDKLTDINDKGDMLFWKQFYDLCDIFPEVKKKLISEFKL